MKFPSKESQAAFYVGNERTLPRDWYEQQRLSDMNMFSPGWENAGREGDDSLPPVPPLDGGPILTGSANSSTLPMVQRPWFMWLIFVVVAYYIFKKGKKF